MFSIFAEDCVVDATYFAEGSIDEPDGALDNLVHVGKSFSASPYTLRSACALNSLRWIHWCMWDIHTLELRANTPLKLEEVCLYMLWLVAIAALLTLKSLSVIIGFDTRFPDK